MPTASTFADLAAAAAVGMAPAYHAQIAPDRMAIIAAGGDRSFHALNANANRLARALRRRGVAVGDAVCLVCANRAEFAEAMSATNRMGLRVTTVNWHLTGEEMAYIVDNSDATVVLGDARFASALQVAVEGAGKVAVRIAIGGTIPGFEQYEEVIAAEDPSNIDDPVLGRTMLYTSGTTGRPKGVDRPPPGAAQPVGSPPSALPDAGVALAVAVGQAARQNGVTDRHLCTGPLTTPRRSPSRSRVRSLPAAVWC